MTTGVLIIIIIACFFVALFCLFRLGRDDVILIRKNVSTEQLFNLAFLTCFVGVFIGWIGDSLAGGVVAGSLFLMLACKNRRHPVGRIADLFSVAFLCVLPLGFILFSLFNQQYKILYLLSAIFSLLLFLFFLLILLPKALRTDMKDGSVALLFVINVTLLAIFTSVFRRINDNFSFSLEDGLLVAVFAGACFFLVKQEKKSLLRYFKK